MSIDELCALKVPAAKDSVLYLWATASKLLEAEAVIAAWGYIYKTHAIWDKEKVGMAAGSEANTNCSWLATRGKMSPPAQPDRIGSVIRARRGSHSSKPDQVRDWTAKWHPNERKMEMFARPYTEMWPKHDGWETTNTTRGSAPGRLTLTVV
jgi:N6-adenosine-specific RNA methylase IME4